MIDFSGAVEDPSTGLKCVVEEVAVETFDKEQLLTCTHSMIQVCDTFWLFSEFSSPAPRFATTRT